MFFFLHFKFFFSSLFQETTTTNSPTKSVSFGPSKHTQQSPKFALNNDSRLKNNNLQQQSAPSNHRNSSSIDKNNKLASVSGGVANLIEDNCVSHRNKMVAKQEIGSETQVQQTDCVDEDGDSFKYGPGFVSKLRYRYLSLTLRQTSVSKQRPSLAQMRRSTSLNNLLDEETDDHCQDGVQGDENADMKESEVNTVNGNGNNNSVAQENQKNHILNGIEKPLTEAYPPPSDGHHVRSSRSVDKSLNLKRARSVEAILRYDNTAWERDIQKDHIEAAPVKQPHEVTIEDKIQSARERPQSHPPKRLTSLIDDDERPPPGICKQTMRIFEASANRKRNLATRPIGQEIANKVALFKCQEKPAVASKKPIIHPRITSPKPIHHLNNNSNNASSKTMNNSEKFAKFAKEKTVLPKLDINIIKNNLETKSNGSWSPADNKDSYRNSKLDYSPAHSDSSLSSTPNVLSPFRNSMSPQLNEQPAKKLDPTASPLISSLSSKLNNLHMETSTPKAYNKSNNLLKIVDEPADDKDTSDNKHDNNNVEVKSAHDDALSPKTVMSFIPKINNNVGTNGKLNHDKSPVDNGEIRSVKENVVITKPAQAPPPPPYTAKSQPSRDNNDKSSFVPPVSDSKNVVDSSESTVAPKWTVKKKSWSAQNDDAPANTIVFNFSDRKDVPDYIEHDGLILRRKRELPKVSRSSDVKVIIEVGDVERISSCLIHAQPITKLKYANQCCTQQSADS